MFLAGKEDRIESEKIEFFERVRAMYLKRASQYPERYRIIDANKTIDEVKKNILEILDNFFMIS